MLSALSRADGFNIKARKIKVNYSVTQNATYKYMLRTFLVDVLGLHYCTVLLGI